MSLPISLLSIYLIDENSVLCLLKGPDDTCAPYDYDSNDKPIVPCGSIANSKFNGM